MDQNATNDQAVTMHVFSPLPNLSHLIPARILVVLFLFCFFHPVRVILPCPSHLPQKPRNQTETQPAGFGGNQHPFV